MVLRMQPARGQDGKTGITYAHSKGLRYGRSVARTLRSETPIICLKQVPNARENGALYLIK